jgi:hypothetical protein
MLVGRLPQDVLQPIPLEEEGGLVAPTKMLHGVAAYRDQLRERLPRESGQAAGETDSFQPLKDSVKERPSPVRVGRKLPNPAQYFRERAA